jgi:alcohol dehydrogenase
LMLADDQEAALPMGQVIAKELEILGSHGMQAHRYPPLLDMIRSGKLDPEKMIRRTVSLAESLDLLQRMGEFKDPGVSVIDRFE